MTEQIDSQSQQEDESDSLRRTLEQMRKEAEREVMRLNQRLAEREYAPDSSVATATERLAMQQEMMVLQQTLEAKEQALDHITEECRRLEDEIEDQNMAVDGLKQEVDRKDKQIKGLETELQNLRDEFRVLEKRVEEPPKPVVVTPAVPVEKTAPKKASTSLLLIGALVTFVALSIGMLGFIYLFWDQIHIRLPGVELGGAPVATQTVAIQGEPISRPVPTGTPTPPKPNAGPVGAVVDSTPSEAALAAASSPPNIRNDRLRGGALGPPMVMIEAGTFTMGNTSLSGDDFSPSHEVTLGPFWISQHEVTFQEYDRFARATGRAPPDDYGWGRGSRPVVGVSWDDAKAYVAWLSRETNRAYRLPTEAEWEYAARASTNTPYWWGYDMSPGRAVCFDCGTPWDNRSTAPVGSFPANPFGLFDMGGNVMEWVDDCYNSSYRGAPSDGRSWLAGDCSQRVARGSAFNKPSFSMRSYVRSHFTPDTRLNMIGFRVARDI